MEHHFGSATSSDGWTCSIVFALLHRERYSCTDSPSTKACGIFLYLPFFTSTYLQYESLQQWRSYKKKQNGLETRSQLIGQSNRLHEFGQPVSKVYKRTLEQTIPIFTSCARRCWCCCGLLHWQICYDVDIVLHSARDSMAWLWLSVEANASGLLPSGTLSLRSKKCHYSSTRTSLGARKVKIQKRMIESAGAHSMHCL